MEEQLKGKSQRPIIDERLAQIHEGISALSSKALTLGTHSNRFLLELNKIGTYPGPQEDSDAVNNLETAEKPGTLLEKLDQIVLRIEKVLNNLHKVVESNEVILKQFDEVL